MISPQAYLEMFNEEGIDKNKVAAIMQSYFEFNYPFIVDKVTNFIENGDIPNDKVYSTVTDLHNRLVASTIHNSLDIDKLIFLMRSSFGGAAKVYTRGSCVKFAMILNFVYPNGEIYYNGDHAIFKLNDKFYDITGEVQCTNHIPLKDYPLMETYLIMSLKYDERI